MNPDTNQFYEADRPEKPTHLAFKVGEEVEIKGHIFMVTHIRLAPRNQLVLKPLRKARS